MALSDQNDQYLRRTLADFGTPTGESGLHYQRDSFTGNGATSVYTLSQTPSSSQPPQIFLGSVLAWSPTYYSISGITLTFVAPVPNGTAILAVYEY